MTWAEGRKKGGGGEKAQEKKNKKAYFFLAVAFIVGNTENTILLRQKMKHYKSIAILHIFCIQLEFRYLAWNLSPA